jgi:hypothetical protein
MVGLVAILAGAYLLYFEAGFDRWVSIGILGAGLLLFVGLAVMTFASSAPTDPSPRVVREERPVVERVVERAPRTVVEREDRRER